MRCFKILELHNKRERKIVGKEQGKKCGGDGGFVSFVDTKVWVHTDRLLLTGTALLNLLLGKTTSVSYFPIDFPWFAFKLSAKPIWWKRYCSRNFCQKICCSYSYGLARAGPGGGYDLVYDADVRRQAGGTTPPTCARDRRNLSKLQETTIGR